MGVGGQISIQDGLGVGPTLGGNREKLGEDRCQTRVWQALDKDVLVILGTELNTLVEAGKNLGGLVTWCG